MRILILPILPALFCLVGSLMAAPAEQALFNGKDLSGWRYYSPQGTAIDSVCSVDAAGVLKVAGKPNGYLATVAAHENYRLKLEWRWLAPKGNSGVLVHMAGADKLWPTSLQFQMKVGAVGEWIPMAEFKNAETLAPGAKSLPRIAANPEKPVGEWNCAEIVCKDDTIECSVNGVLVNRATHCVPAKGPIGIQLEGTPFELRNITLQSLK